MNSLQRLDGTRRRYHATYGPYFFSSTIPVGVDAGAAVGAGVGGAVVGAEPPYDAANHRLHSLHLSVQRTACKEFFMPVFLRSLNHILCNLCMALELQGPFQKQQRKNEVKIRP